MRFLAAALLLADPALGISYSPRAPAGGGQKLVGPFMQHEAQPQLLEVILALTPPRRLSRRLHGRQQQADENADNCNHHQQLD